jgi:uronate dehydrogenase
VLRSNIAGTWHVLDAAVQYSVPRIVYGSSTWAIRGRLEEALEATAGPTIDSNAPPRPWRTYGLSKAFGEVAGRMLIDEGRLEAFVSVRIGFCPPDGIPPSKEDHLRFHWVGKKDMTSLLRRCVEADISGYHVVYGVSDMPGSRFNLSHTRALLAWNPSEGRPGASSA